MCSDPNRPDQTRTQPFSFPRLTKPYCRSTEARQLPPQDFIFYFSDPPKKKFLGPPLLATHLIPLVQTSQTLLSLISILLQQLLFSLPFSLIFHHLSPLHVRETFRNLKFLPWDSCRKLRGQGFEEALAREL